MPLFVIVVLTAAMAAARTVAAAPVAPSLVSPAAGASLTTPLTISWSAVTDPNGIVAYNWQVSPSSSFASVIAQGSTNGDRQAVVSGLANGTFFWRVQAVDGSFTQGAWSAPRSFTVTGPGAGSPAPPTLEPTVAYSTFHPFELIRFRWSAVPGAATYRLESSRDANFAVANQIVFDNIPGTDPSFSYEIGNPEGNYFARVRAVSADGVLGVASNTVSFSVFFNNPIGPAPQIISPVNNPTLTLPVTLNWADVPNPQPSGYEIQISRNATFTNIEDDDPQLTDPTRVVTSLTPGAKFWRVRSAQGDNSPTTAAETAWSATGTFTISTAPATPVSVSLAKMPLSSSESTMLQLQLTAAVPSAGASIALSSSNPSALPLPASVTMQGNLAWLQFQVQAGQVTGPTPVTITATLNGKSASLQFNVMPPELQALTLSPSTISGGSSVQGTAMLTGQAPAGGADVALSSGSPAVTVPATVHVPAGSFSASFPVQTHDVTVNTDAVVTAKWGSVSKTGTVTVRPSPKPVSVTLTPATMVGGSAGSGQGLVVISSASPFDQSVALSSNNPSVLPFLPNALTIPANTTRGGFQVIAQAVSTPTVVTITVSGGGATVTADLTVNPPNTPPPGPTLSAFSVSPTSVTGGTSATGSVTLASAAPSGGSVVTLGSNQPGAANLPASVTVPAGARTATFTVTTSPSAGTTVQLSARLGDTILFASLGVTPPSGGGGGGGTGTLAAPSIVSPAASAQVTRGKSVTFDWSDVSGAATYTIQIDDSQSFTAPMTMTQTVSASQFSTASLPSGRLYWRVRANNASGAAGTWSSARRLDVK